MNPLPMLGRLCLWQKFAILAVIGILLATIPTFMYINETNKVIAAAELEMAGMEPAAALLKVIRLTQQHRGLSGMFLGEAAGTQETREAKQREVDQAMAGMRAIVKGIGDKPVAELWNRGGPDWEAIRAGVSGRSLSRAQSFADHTAHLEHLLSLNEMLADHFGLSLDPYLETYQLIQAMYFHLPRLTEETEKMRAKGAALLAKKDMSAADKVDLAVLSAQLNTRLAQTLNSYQKAAAAYPVFALALGDNVDTMSKLTLALLQLSSAKIDSAETLDYPAADYFSEATKAIDAQYVANSLAGKEITMFLAGKKREAHVSIWITLAVSGAVLLVAGLVAGTLMHSISRPLATATALAQRVAAGDLTDSEFNASGTNETAQLMRALKDMNGSLVKIVKEVRAGTEIIALAAGDIASGNQNLSARTEHQASSLQETASSMEQLTSTVRQNGDNAQQANLLALSASEIAVRGGAVVAQVVGTMDDIHDSSKKIVEIISVIDGIAFQTNILALNAAVEAARAGEQGRGFAVVAAEVRNLAQRSASAAREIKGLISDSVDRVEVGSKLVAQAGNTMGEIVASVKQVTEIISEISAVSQEQIAGIEQVNLAISVIEDVTQHNAALVQQAAAAAESLQDQASNQAQVVSVFNLGDMRVKPLT